MKENGAKPWRILVIEDDEPTLEAILLKLKGENITADSAANGVDGLKKLKKGGVSCVLLDLHMPGGDGFSFMEEKNKVGILRDVPVIIFSNLSQREFINRALELGVKGYLIKAQHSIEDIVEEVKRYVKTGRCLIDG